MGHQNDDVSTHNHTCPQAVASRTRHFEYVEETTVETGMGRKHIEGKTKPQNEETVRNGRFGSVSHALSREGGGF